MRPTVKANHRLLFIRAGVLVIVILGLGLVLPSPSGLYEPALLTTHLGAKQANVATFASRFLSDTGVLEDQATRLNLTTDQYGMVREETGNTPGAWWLSPIGLLNHTVLASDDNGDRDAAIIFGALLLTMLAFPFIPYLNRLPDALKVYTVIWGKEHRAAKRSSR